MQTRCKWWGFVAVGSVLMTLGLNIHTASAIRTTAAKGHSATTKHQNKDHLSPKHVQTHVQSQKSQRQKTHSQFQHPKVARHLSRLQARSRTVAHHATPAASRKAAP